MSGWARGQKLQHLANGVFARSWHPSAVQTSHVPLPAPSFSEATVPKALAVTRLLPAESRASRGVLHDAPRLPPRTSSAPAV